MINILLINRLFAQNTLDKNRFIILRKDENIMIFFIDYIL